MGTRSLSWSQKKTVMVYVLLLSGVLPRTHAQSGFVSPTAMPQQFSAASSSFTNNQVFPATSSFTNTQPFVNSIAYPQDNTFATRAQTFTGNQFLPVNNGLYPPVNQHASKGYVPMSTMGGFYPSYPVNGQYWTGQMGPQYYQGQMYNQHPMSYPQYGQTWTGNNQYMYPGQYSSYQQYGYYHPQSGYSSNFGQYPGFDASYWTGHMYPPPVYMHPGPVHYPQQYYPGHQMMYPGQYHAMPYHYVPRDRGFLGGTGSGLSKGLIGAVLVGVVAGTIARKG